MSRQRGVVDFPHFSDEVAVIKLWMHCRGRADRHAGVRCEPIQEWDEDKLDDLVLYDISDLWTARHEIKLGCNRILVDTLFCRQYREINATLRRLSIILPESIRTFTTV